MEIRKLLKCEMEKSVSLWQYCFQDPEPFTRWYYEHRAGEVLVTGGEEIAAQAVAVPVRFSVRGEAREGRIISGVATAPQWRGQGLMRRFMPLCHEYMAERGAVLAGLYPFDYTFYEKYGWARCGEVLRVNVPLARLPARKLTGKFQIYSDLPVNTEAFARVYQECYKAYSGHVLRDADLFAQRQSELALEGGFAVLYLRDKIPEGYLLYRFDGKTVVVEEFGALTHAARADILSFLAGHASTMETASWLSPPGDPMWRLLPDARGVATIEPYVMLRILDVPGALNGLPAGDGELILEVTDDHAPRNAGNWLIRGSLGSLSAERTAAHAEARLSIGQLTQWALGCFGAEDLREMGCSLPAPLALRMDRMLPACRVFLYEMY